MSTLSAAFTATDSSGNALCYGHGDASFSISGTFVGTVILEKAVGNSDIAWNKLLGPFTGPVSGLIPAHPGELYRIRCTSFTSGTVSYSFAGTLPTTDTLPSSAPAAGSGIWWNNGGVLSIA